MTNNTKVTNVCCTYSTKEMRVRPITHAKAMSQSEQTVTKQFRLMVLLQLQVDGTISNACSIPQTIGPQSLCQKLTLEQKEAHQLMEFAALVCDLCAFSGTHCLPIAPLWTVSIPLFMTGTLSCVLLLWAMKFYSIFHSSVQQ